MSALFLKMFGVFVGCCVLRIHHRQNSITTDQLTKIVSVYLSVNLLACWLSENFFVHWCVIFVPIIGSFLFFFLNAQRLESQFQQDFPEFLTAVILRMKLGAGFRRSFHEATEQVPRKYSARFRYIQENVVFSPHNCDKKMTAKAPFLDEIIAELSRVDQSSHKSIERLENFRGRLSIVNDFRRRSGRIRGQVHLQAGILFVIYAISFAFSAFMFSLEGLEALISVSLALFISGLIAVFYLGQGVKWKI